LMELMKNNAGEYYFNFSISIPSKDSSMKQIIFDQLLWIFD